MANCFVTERKRCMKVKCYQINIIYYYIYIYDLVPKGVHENRTKGVENKVDDTLKLVVFLECAQC